MRQRLRNLLQAAVRRLTPRPDQSSQLAEAHARERFLTEQLAAIAQTEAVRNAENAFRSMAEDLIEAQAMAGAGPWKIGPAALQATESLTKRLRESFDLNLKEDLNLNTQGAYGDLELALSTIDWRRELSFSVLQFSRWGIKQIILICRLYWIKNPIVRRLINVCAAYVFARGVEVTTSDESANEVLEDFFSRNKKVFGKAALVQSERKKDTDGNLYWVMFPDKTDSGKCAAREIDATEIEEIVCNPEDSDEEWFFLRIWTQANWDAASGTTRNEIKHAWYPAMWYDPPEKPDTLRNWPVLWNTATYHRKVGTVGKWQHGCPRAYPMIDWAKEARHYLEACASVAQQLMQIGLLFTTKGGQQAIEGVKQQMSTTTGPTTPLWDANPPAVSGSMMAMGTGSKLEAFKTQGAGMDPEKVRQYKLMCCMVKDVPETFLGDVSTGNLATATTLDRPTETCMMALQEEWVEDLTEIARFVLQTDAGAAGGRLSEARGLGVKLNIVECARKRLASGRMVYEAFKKAPDTIEIQVNFPDIREGDQLQNVTATVKAMTLENKAGQVIGIDQKAGVKRLYDELDIEGGEELAEQQYPESTYDPDRTKEVLPPPIMRPRAMPGGIPQPTPAQAPDIPGQPTPGTSASVESALARVKEALK